MLAGGSISVSDSLSLLNRMVLERLSSQYAHAGRWFVWCLRLLHCTKSHDFLNTLVHSMLAGGSFAVSDCLISLNRMIFGRVSSQYARR